MREKEPETEACPFPPRVETPDKAQLNTVRSLSLKGTYSTRTRILGIILGASLLASIFLLPFGYRGARPLTLYEVFQQNILLMRESPGYMTPTMYLLTAVFLLIIVAGFLGAFPRFSALVAFVSVSSLVFVGLLNFGRDMGYGIGYYAIWLLSVAAVLNAFTRTLHRGTQKPDNTP